MSLGVGLNGPVTVRLIVFRDTPARTVNAACNRPHKTTHSRQDSSAILFFTAFVNRAIVSDGEAVIIETGHILQKKEELSLRLE